MEAQGKSVLIKPDVLPERTPSGILIIPKGSKEFLPEWGTVVLAGKACDEVRAGHRVYFPRKTASIETINGEDHYWLQEHKIYYYE